MELCISGFNSAFVTFGESQSGKSFTLSGENVHKQGLVTLAIDGLFSRLSEEFGKGKYNRVRVFTSKISWYYLNPDYPTHFYKISIWRFLGMDNSFHVCGSNSPSWSHFASSLRYSALLNTLL